MNLSDFKGNKNILIQKSCDQYLNARAKFLELNSYLEQNAALVLENQVKMTSDQTSCPIRGILALPRDFADLKTWNKKSIFEKIHMCCMTRLNDEFNVYSHFLNSEGIPFNDKVMESNDLIVILLSTFLVLNSKVRFYFSKNFL